MSNTSFVMVDRSCPLCGSTEFSREYAKESIDTSRLGKFAFASRKMPEYMHHRLVLCDRCDLLYCSPVPSANALEEEYLHAAYDSGRESHYAARTYARLVKPILGSLPDRRGTLDIGAGDGGFLEELIALGFTNVCGAEPSAAPIAAAKETIRPLIRHAPFRACEYPSQSYSLITCFQTMEHVPDPLRLCREAYSLLKPGGAVMCVVHNRLALSVKILGRRSPVFDIEHLQLFSKKSATCLLSGAGFERVFTKSIVNTYPLSYWTRLFPFPDRLKRALIAGMDGLGVGRITTSLPAGNLVVCGFAVPVSP